MISHQNSNLLVCFRTSTTLRFTIPESSRSWRTYRVATPLFLTTCRKKSGVCWGVTGSLCVQGWVRVTVRGTGRACCTGTLSWLQQPSIKVGLMLKQEVEAGCSEFLHIVGRRAEIQHVKRCFYLMFQRCMVMQTGLSPPPLRFSIWLAGSLTTHR